MSEQTPNQTIHDGVGNYDVVVLIEHALTRTDATQLRSLHEDIEDRVVYHVLVPLEDAAARIESAMGSLAAGEVMSSPAMAMNEVDLDAVRRDCQDRSSRDLATTLEVLSAAGAVAEGTVVSDPPIDALAAAVAEFFHLDWTSRARRKIGVPVLHLLEHETFDEQAGGGGEGVTGL